MPCHTGLEPRTNRGPQAGLLLTVRASPWTAVSNEVQTMVKQEERDERSRLQRLTEGQRSVELAKDEVA